MITKIIPENVCSTTSVEEGLSPSTFKPAVIDLEIKFLFAAFAKNFTIDSAITSPTPSSSLNSEVGASMMAFISS